MGTCPVKYKVDFSTLPATMRNLPLDDRFLPVPWFCEWFDGKPDFRVMDPQKFKRALRDKLCWVCGQKLGINVCFVAGPMCGVNRTSSEPPSHLSCARWSAQNCPFLSIPKMVRREDDIVNNATLRENSAGIAITRNPGVAMLWSTREYEVFRVENGILIQMGNPTAVEWYAHGRPATRAEVDASIEGGLPSLLNLARQQPGGIEALQQAVNIFQRYLPET